MSMIFSQGFKEDCEKENTHVMAGLKGEITKLNKTIDTQKHDLRNQEKFIRENIWSFRKEYIELQKYTKDLVERLNKALKSCGGIAEDNYYHLMTEADSYINQGNCNTCRHMITAVLGDSELDTEEEVSGCNISPNKCHWEPKE